MRNILLAVMTISSMLVGASVITMLSSPVVLAASKDKPPKMNPKVLKPLQAALALANEEKFSAAQEELQKADAVADKTPFEQFQVDELLGFVALKQKNYDTAAKYYERGSESGLLLPEQVNDRLRLLAQLFLQTQPRNLKKSGEYGKRWLDATGERDPVMLGLVGQSAYFGDNFADAAKYMKEAISIAKPGAEKPDENWLLILQASAAKLNNVPQIVETTTDLVQYYPRKEHWQTLFQSLLSRAANKDRQNFQIFRLMYATDAMSQADDFSEAANVAIQLGSPGEALNFMQKGYSSGVLETSGDKAKSEARLAEAKRLAGADQKTLPQFEKEAVASKTGEADVKLGEAYLSYDQAAKGLEAIQRGIAKGGVKSVDEANLALGRAYLRTGNSAEAVNAFENVTSQEYAQLAKLWAIFAGQKQ